MSIEQTILREWIREQSARAFPYLGAKRQGGISGRVMFRVMFIEGIELRLSNVFFGFRALRRHVEWSASAYNQPL
ncbi:hypothetical protein IW967_02745 [Alicyclobacillus mali]|uniref:Transposase n=1 Tax=Alicyclobacillus mali (ex Roth et al. 2021) TaxID=1123961 RepID=A0ABS0F0F9_9BACL|nr:hypothetical protein [Alicyclobacillus mali (ex Roth et al. 2021)]MBF8376791.1 hypothetical protein [Alicyclobacillus mali (ex Roth et al. 2021)]